MILTLVGVNITVLIVIGLFLIRVFGRSRLVLSINALIICSIIWKVNTGVVFATELSEYHQLQLYMLFRIGELLVPPTIFFIIFCIIAETSMKPYVITLTKRIVQAFYCMTFLAYLIIVSEIYPRDTSAFIEAVYINQLMNNQNLIIIWNIHSILYLAMALLLVLVSKLITNFYLRELVRPLSYGVLLSILLHRVNLLDYWGLSSVILASNIITISLLYGILKTYTKTNNDYKKFLHKFFIDNSLNLYSTELMHEVKNNIGVIRGFNDLIQQAIDKRQVVDKDDIQVFSEQIQIAVDNLNCFVSDFKRFASTNEANLQEEDLREIIEKVYAQFYSKGNLRITFHTNEKIYAQVNRYFLKQMLFNILKNALEESERRAFKFCEVEFNLYYHGNMAVIDIYDSCNSIKKEYVEDVMKLFQSTKKEGFGIGLIASKKLAMYQFGDLTIENLQGRKTIRLTFKRQFTLGEIEYANLYNG